MLPQTETRPISHDQLVIEVKGIYASLFLVEAKYIDLDELQQTRAQKDAFNRVRLEDAQWQSFTALYKLLLNEYYDFLLASQYPLASSKLSKLAATYSMLARI